MDAMSIRSRGRRAAPKRSGGAPFNIGPSIGLASTGRPGEFKLNMNQMEALESLYTASPAITAARSVLRGQLFGGGIVLRRGGKDVTLKPEFQRYLSSKWLSFAGDVLDSLLKWGLCVVAYDEDEELKDRASKVPAVKVAKRDAVLAPLVPPRECIEIAYRQSGRMGYTRKYVVFNMAAPVHATKVDDDARVYIREQPDSVGNVVSPMSKVFELGSFVTALTELALTAEITNARPRMWTQQRKKEHGQGIETNQLFFDSESRAVQSDLDTQGNAEAAKQLAMQSQLVQVINRLQQRKEDDNGFDHVRNSFTGRGVAAGKHTHTHVPPEVPPRFLLKSCIFAAQGVQRPSTCPMHHRKLSASLLPTGPRARAVGGAAAAGARRPRAAPAPLRRAVWRRVRRAERPSLLRSLCQQVNRTVRARSWNPTPVCHSLTPRSSLTGFRS